MQFRRRLALVIAAATFSLPGFAHEDFPSKQVQLVIPFGTGNGVDQLGRAFAEVLHNQMGQPVVVVNREGAGGIIGGSSVARSAPDGYTVMLTAHPPFAIATSLQKEPSYDPVSSFTPVAKVGAVPLVAVAASSMPFKTWEEFAAYAKANPEKTNYAASGVGSPGQLFTRLIRLQTGLPIQEVSYKSTAQAMTDTLGGHVQMSLVSMPAAAAHLKAGTLHALAVGSPERLPAMPEVPTLAELIGQPGFEASVWYGFLVPADTPQELVDTLYQEIAKASQNESIAAFLERAHIAPDLQDSQHFSASIEADVATARKMIELTNMKP